MRRLIFFCWLIMTALAVPVRAQAYAPESWLTAGSPNELWTVEQDYITGYSQHHFTDSFLVSDPVIVPVPQDFKFSFEMTPVRGTDHNFVWNFQDTQNYYQVHFNGGAVWISRFINGQEMLSVGKNFPISLGETYQVSLRQVGNLLTLLIDKQEIAAFDDLTHNPGSSGSVGFKLSPGAIIPVETRFEKILFHDAAITLLPITAFRQNYPLWMDTEYDTATQWSSEPTIARWGCALTSLVMIMHYHGLAKMPDGQPVEPGTVNQWLNDQEDGYVGAGLVNWFAAMRLVKEISERYSVPGNELPKLEFSYQGIPWREAAKNEILAERPLIAQVPGHFTVVNGYDERIDGFLVTDPLFDKQYLSEYQSVLSLRLFRPSQTDLSALVVVHRPNRQVNFKDQSGAVVSQTWEESIDSFIESTGAWFFTAVFQPTEGVYKLELDGAADPNSVQLFGYDTEANLTTLAWPENYSGGEPLFIQFTKAGEIAWAEEPAAPEEAEETEETKTFSWERFMQELDRLKAENKLSQSLFIRMKTLAQYAQAAAAESRQRYKNYLRNILEIEKTENSNQEFEELKVMLLQ